jgi:hypothetical protein
MGLSPEQTILGHKESLNKYKKIEITPYYNAIKLELKNKSSRKYNQLEVGQHIAHLSVSHRRNKKKSKVSQNLMNMKTQTTRTRVFFICGM